MVYVQRKLSKSQPTFHAIEKLSDPSVTDSYGNSTYLKFLFLKGVLKGRGTCRPLSAFYACRRPTDTKGREGRDLKPYYYEDTPSCLTNKQLYFCVHVSTVRLYLYAFCIAGKRIEEISQVYLIDISMPVRLGKYKVQLF